MRKHDSVFAFELKGADLLMHFDICPILLKDRKGSKKGFYEPQELEVRSLYYRYSLKTKADCVIT